MPSFLKNPRIIAGIVVVVLLFIGIGMWLSQKGGSGSPTATANIPTEVPKADVTYVSNDVVVPDSISKHIASVDKDKLVFDGAVDVSNLPTGTPLMFPQKAVRRISHIERENGKTVIYTDPAKLNEVIKDADFQWKQGFSFGKMAAGDLEKIRPIFGETALAQVTANGGNVRYNGDLQGWHITVELSPNSAESRLDLTIDATKTEGGRARVHADGYISDFTANGGLTYQNSELGQFNYEEQGLHGRLHVIFAGVDLGEDTPLFNIPAELDLPYTVGPLLMQAKLKANLRVNPIVSSGTSSQADITVTYGADRGFRFENGHVEPLGQLDNQDVAVTGDTVSAGQVAVGMGVGIEFPRLELSMYGETIVPYLTLDNYYYSLYTPDPPCQEGGLRQKALIGLTASFLGYEYSQESEIWKREQIHSLPGSHCQNPDHPDTSGGS